MCESRIGDRDNPRVVQTRKTEVSCCLRVGCPTGRTPRGVSLPGCPCERSPPPTSASNACYSAQTPGIGIHRRPGLSESLRGHAQGAAGPPTVLAQSPGTDTSQAASHVRCSEGVRHCVIRQTAFLAGIQSGGVLLDMKWRGGRKVREGVAMFLGCSAACTGVAPARPTCAVYIYGYLSGTAAREGIVL